MKGLYIGCDPKNLKGSTSFFSQEINEIQLAGKKIKISFVEISNHEINQIKKQNEESCFIVVVGWFIFENKINANKELFTALQKKGAKALIGINGGIFIGFFHSKKESFIFNDPLGLFNHYYLINNKELILSPSLFLIENSNLNLEKKSALLSGILDKRGHLFGDFTCYSNVKRLPPASILRFDGKVESYSLPMSTNPIGTEEVPRRIKEIIGMFPKKMRQLPLSGGLDSRLILSQGDFQQGYCYGPHSSGDRPIAKSFKGDFENYQEYDFTAPAQPIETTQIYAEILETPLHLNNKQLLASYRHASTFMEGERAVFDGFLGDALQRGVFMYMGGLLGEVYRFFPILYQLIPLSCRFLLRRRYKNLTEEEFELVYEDFVCRTKKIDLDNYAKVTYYEFIWARGARFVANGALIINGQFANIVPVFADPVVFSALIREKYTATIRFETVLKIWKNVAEKYKEIKFENGYKVGTPNFIKPKLALIWRLLIHYVPGFENYANTKSKH